MKLFAIGVIVATIGLSVFFVLSQFADSDVVLHPPTTAPAGHDVTSPPPYDEIQVRLYYYDSERDHDESGNILCSRKGLVPVTRTILATDAVEENIERVIQMHLEAALTENEQEQFSVDTELPLSGFSLQDVKLDGEQLTLYFADPESQTIGGACRVGVLWFQIEQTALQFPQVERVQFMPETLFQP